ncbi:MAG TPA: hypothetical protein VK081_14660, partial [Planctomycetota bacterium]|nr:hypothetical protein [Planctomycetota bacterium]
MRTLPLWIVALVAVPAAQETTRAPEAQFALAAGEHDLRTVIAAAASYLGRNLLVDAIQGDPKVTLQIGQKLDRDGCFAVVTQLAWTHGLVLVPLDYERGIWEFVPYQGPRRDELRSRAPLLPLDEVRKLAGTRIMVMAVIQLQHLRGSAVAQTLRMISTSQSTLEIGTAGAETSIVVRGFVD